jgi:hypothetical protein
MVAGLVALLSFAPALAQQAVTPKIVEGTQIYPAYPDSARRLGIQGTTTLRVQVGAVQLAIKFTLETRNAPEPR